MEKLLRLSASKLKSFASCPRKYYYEYIERQPKDKHPAAALGSAVHKTIELVYAQRQDPISTFLTEFDKELDKYHIDDSGWTKYRIDGMKMVGDYRYDGYQPLEVEREFILPFPDADNPICEIHGYLDQIYAWGFIDLKTNSRRPTQDALNNDLQFILYAWAYKQLYGKDPDLCIWYHLRDGKEMRADVVGKLDIVIPVISEILSAQVTGYYPKKPYKESQFCLFCPFKQLCAEEPLYGSVLEGNPIRPSGQ